MVLSPRLQLRKHKSQSSSNFPRNTEPAIGGWRAGLGPSLQGRSAGQQVGASTDSEPALILTRASCSLGSLPSWDVILSRIILTRPGTDTPSLLMAPLPHCPCANTSNESGQQRDGRGYTDPGSAPTPGSSPRT